MTTKPPIFCRLDYFLLSENLVNSASLCEHRIGYKSDHSIVELNINIANFQRGPGYFKLNNSFLLDKVYQEIIKNSITEITSINEDANPNTLWEFVKGTIRNESIKYGSKKKKETDKLEKQLTNEIENLNKTIHDTLNNSTLDLLKQEIDTKTAELNSLIDKKIDGYILRSKAQVVEEGEKKQQIFCKLG